MVTADVNRRLAQIVANIERVERHLASATLRQFLDDEGKIDAIERCLQRICEGIVKIGAYRMADISPTLPFDEVRGLGNRLRHDYDLIDPIRIYETATERLPILRVDCVRALSRNR